ncbi:MAG TPA: DUF3237 family protein [Steroidobacteraceae bacterium]|nr:DUF3237 family protein [Steroidobacteraceae bacterium]
MSDTNGPMDRRSVLAGLSSVGLVAGATLRGNPSAAAPAASAEPAASTYGAADPAIAKVGLRWAFSARVIFADRFNIAAPVQRGYTSVGIGEIWGPRLQGRVLPHSGADYYKNTFNTYYMFEPADGTLIFIHNRGTKRRFAAQPPPGADPIPDAITDPNAPGGWVRFRVAPTFVAPVGPHDWMNRTVFVGNATKHQNPDHTVFTYYEVL